MTDEKEKNNNEQSEQSERESALEYTIDDDGIHGTIMSTTISDDGSIIEYVEPDGVVHITVRMERTGDEE